MDILTLDEIRGFYDKLLTKPGYFKILAQSISPAKIDQILSYAERVNREAAHQLDNGIGADSPMNLYLKKNFGFEFPVFPDEQTKHCDYSDWTYPQKLDYWFQSSMAVIDAMTKVEPEKTVPEPVIKKKKPNNKLGPIWCYAYFHLIWEKKDERKKPTMGNKKEIAEMGRELYNIDGDQFYNQYDMAVDVSLVNSIRGVNLKEGDRRISPKQREMLKKVVFELSEIHNCPECKAWWNVTIMK